MLKIIDRTVTCDASGKQLSVEEREEIYNPDELEYVDDNNSQEEHDSFPFFYFVDTKDEHGRVTEKRCFNKKTNECENVTIFKYDAKGRLKSEKEKCHTERETYCQTTMFYYDGNLTTMKSVIRYANGSEHRDTLTIAVYNDTQYEEHVYNLKTGIKISSQFANDNGGFVRDISYLSDGSYIVYTSEEMAVPDISEYNDYR